MKIFKNVTLIAIILFSINSFSQEFDYTFCLGRIKLVLNSDGSASQTLSNSVGGAQSFISGNFEIYNQGMPSEIIKINFKGIEYRYDLIKNGQGIPSMLIDAQGRNYTLCKYSKSKDDYLERMIKEDQITAAEDKRVQKILQPKINLYIQEVKKISLLINNPQKRSSVPLLLGKLDDKDDINYYKYFTKEQREWYNTFSAKVKIIKGENVEKTGDVFGEIENWNLMSYFSMNNTKNMLPDPKTCKFKYETKRPRESFSQTIRTTGSDSDGGYVINRELYNYNDRKIATITQNENYYILNLDGTYGARLDQIQIKKWGGSVGKDMEIEFASSTNEYILSEMYQKYGGKDEVKKYQLEYVVDSVNRGCPLVGAIHLLNRN